MDYIYDIVLNFQNEYYDFYEWQTTDKIINVKKIPIYQISNKDYLCIKQNDIIIDKSTLPKPNKMFLLTSGIEIIAILIDSSGKVLKKSSLLFEEADDILKDKDEIKNISIKYHVIKKHTVRLISRNSQAKLNYINNFLKKIDKESDEYFLKYLYYDIYDEQESDINIIHDKLTSLAKEDLEKLYQSIIKVKQELKI